MTKKGHVQKNILAWYDTYRRSLPWRQTRDPYHILVSEVMLQQTQVDRVIAKYHEFLGAFPTVHDLAHAKTADVIRVWAGLGYNRRALYLQKTAQAVVTQYRGQFPKEIDLLKELPGIGDYTARAILSFAFEVPVPMMDTNHRRFYQRVFFGIHLKKDDILLMEAETVLPKKRSYDWNQALMDFGSLICLSGRPKCEVCPIQAFCAAYPEILQVIEKKQKKKKKTVPFKETDRYFRGRIIDLLRIERTTTVRTLANKYPDLSKERLQMILTRLEKEGLIQVKKGSILLP
ncbi:MAG TPA: A/G-specific adenine glycosylase [Candidatus Kapabacteria bacterium]|nr:A/G-specific adenine glycosylase [Candidatus Kapabacteria bacterium]